MMIYLDYNAGAPLHPDAWDAMAPLLRDRRAACNAASVHHFGRMGGAIIETARAQLAALVGCTPDQVVFNSGATEGNNTVLQYFTRERPDEIVLIAADAHPSMAGLADMFGNIARMPVDENGLIDMSKLDHILKTERSDHKKISLISCMAANNETGVIQDVSKLYELARGYGAFLHCDATQAVGRIPVTIDHADFLTLSAHKIGGPQGTGALVTGSCGENPVLLYGGGQENFLRAGTQNTAGIAGFGAAAHASLRDMTRYQTLAALRDEMEKTIERVAPDTVFHGKNAPRLPNTSLFTHKGINMHSLLMALDLDGIAVSNGSACSSGTIKPGPTLPAMGLDEKTAANALRVSTGWATKEADIKTFLRVWEKIYTRMANKKDSICPH